MKKKKAYVVVSFALPSYTFVLLHLCAKLADATVELTLKKHRATLAREAECILDSARPYLYNLENV